MLRTAGKGVCNYRKGYQVIIATLTSHSIVREPLTELIANDESELLRERKLLKKVRVGEFCNNHAQDTMRKFYCS